jgi:hypothetical protein
MSDAAASAVIAIADSRGIPLPDCDWINPICSSADEFLRQLLDLANRIRSHRHQSHLHPKHINEALAATRQPLLYGYRSPFSYVQIPGSELEIPTSRTVPLSEIVHLPLPECPYETWFDFHWLALSGNQPLTGENDPEVTSHVVTTVEIQWPTDTAEPPPPGRRTPEKVGVLKEERALFLSVLMRLQENEVIDDVIEELNTQRSLQKLVPFFLRYFVESMRVNLRQPSFLLRLLRGAHALFLNSSLDHTETFQLFLSLAITPLLTTIAFNESEDAQFRLRDESASFVGVIIAQFQPMFPTLRGTVMDRFAHVLYDPESAPRLKYGAIAGLMAIGSDYGRDVIVPLL